LSPSGSNSTEQGEEISDDGANPQGEVDALVGVSCFTSCGGGGTTAT
jgi:hypothetical protein